MTKFFRHITVLKYESMILKSKHKWTYKSLPPYNKCSVKTLSNNLGLLFSFILWIHRWHNSISILGQLVSSLTNSVNFKNSSSNMQSEFTVLVWNTVRNSSVNSLQTFTSPCLPFKLLVVFKLDEQYLLRHACQNASSSFALKYSNSSSLNAWLAFLSACLMASLYRYFHWSLLSLTAPLLYEEEFELVWTFLGFGCLPLQSGSGMSTTLFVSCRRSVRDNCMN